MLSMPLLVDVPMPATVPPSICVMLRDNEMLPESSSIVALFTVVTSLAQPTDRSQPVVDGSSATSANLDAVACRQV